MEKNYRNKILPSLLLIVLAIAAAFSPAFVRKCSADSSYQQYLERLYTLKTSDNPASYSIFTINGDTIRAEGNYEMRDIKNVYLLGCENAAVSFKRTGTAYAAEITAPFSTGYSYIVLEFDGGVSYDYRIEYDEGWFFGDNHLSDTFSECIENLIEVDDSVSAMYISAESDPDEISYTLSELTRISSEVTENITDEYKKAQALARWVSENVYYDLGARHDSVDLDTISVYNVLKTRRTVCSGYSNLYSALLEAVGIKSVNIKASVIAEGFVTYETLATGVQNHEFTAFYSRQQERWVPVDVVWNSTNIYVSGEYIKSPVSDKYFDITPAALSLNHRCDKAELRSFFSAMNHAPQSGTAAESPAPESAADTSSEPAQTNSAATVNTPITDAPAYTPEEYEQAINQNEAFSIAITMMLVIIGALILLIVYTKLSAYIRKKRRAKKREQNKKTDSTK